MLLSLGPRLNARHVINFPGNLAPRPLLRRYYFPRAILVHYSGNYGPRPQRRRVYTKRGPAKFVGTVIRRNVSVINRGRAIMPDNERGRSVIIDVTS